MQTIGDALSFNKQRQQLRLDSSFSIPYIEVTPSNVGFSLHFILVHVKFFLNHSPLLKFLDLLVVGASM